MGAVMVFRAVPDGPPKGRRAVCFWVEHWKILLFYLSKKRVLCIDKKKLYQIDG